MSLVFRMEIHKFEHHIGFPSLAPREGLIVSTPAPPSTLVFSSSITWGVPWGTPIAGWLIIFNIAMENPVRMDDLGVPPF